MNIFLIILSYLYFCANIVLAVVLLCEAIKRRTELQNEICKAKEQKIKLEQCIDAIRGDIRLAQVEKNNLLVRIDDICARINNKKSELDKLEKLIAKQYMAAMDTNSEDSKTEADLDKQKEIEKQKFIEKQLEDMMNFSPKVGSDK